MAKERWWPTVPMVSRPYYVKWLPCTTGSSPWAAEPSAPKFSSPAACRPQPQSTPFAENPSKQVYVFDTKDSNPSITREISPLGEIMQGKTCPFMVDINGDLYTLAGSPAPIIIASPAFEVFDSRNKCWNPLPDHPVVGSRWLHSSFLFLCSCWDKIKVSVPESPLFCFNVAEPALPWRRLPPPRLPSHGTALVVLDGQLMFTYAFALSIQAFISCLEHNYHYYDDYYADHQGVYNASGSNWGVVACQLSSTDSNDSGT